MINLRINEKKLLSFLLAGSIVLSTYSCSMSIKQKKEKEASTSTPAMTIESVIYENDSNFYRNLLYSYNYNPINGSNQFTINKGTNVYFVDGEVIKTEVINVDTLNVIAIASNNNYALVTLPDGRSGYVDIHALYTTATINDNHFEDVQDNVDSSIAKNTFLYDFQGHVIGYLYETQRCKKISTMGQYIHIELPNGMDGFVLNDTLMETYEYVDGYAVVNKGTKLYYDSDLTQLAYTTDDDVQMLYVEFINQEYAGVYDRSGREIMYAKTTDLKGDFVFNDLTSQRMHCYLNYQLAAVFPTRSGKLASPTHEGVFSIIEKIENFSFTKFPGSRAKHWILYNYGDEEGIHDLVGDDEQNYGNQAYQLDGSHGCIRVPAEASQFIYENYEVGDMVIVAHDNHMLIYNTANNEIGIYNTDGYTRTRSK